VTHEALETGSATLEGLQTMHQGVAVRATWDIDLAEGETFTVELHLHALPNRDAATKEHRGVSA
jgi:hypothetical protein